MRYNQKNGLGCTQITVAAVHMLVLRFSLLLLLLPFFGNVSTVVAGARSVSDTTFQFLPEKGAARTGGLLTMEPRHADGLPAGRYRTMAHVLLTSERVLEVSDRHQLNWQVPTQPEDASGWKNESGMWIWSPRSKPSSLHLPFGVVRGHGNREVNLADFDELWLDLAETGLSESCRVSVEMSESAKNDGAGLVQSGPKIFRVMSAPSGKFSPLLSVDFTKANWKPRDNFYLVKRVLGIEFDEDWRYIQDKQNTVLQRRFHQDLSNVEVLDLFFTPDTLVDRVNVVVSWKSRFSSSDEIVDWDAIPKQIEATAEGTRVRLYLGDKVRAHLAAHGSETLIFLSEVVVFIPGEAEKIADQLPLRKLMFQSMLVSEPIDEAGGIVYLPRHKEFVSQGYERLVVNLRPLARMDWRAAALKRGIVTLLPNDPGQYCGIKPVSLHLVTLANESRPVLVGNALRLSQTLGGPFLKKPDGSNVVEWIEMDSYLPFALLPTQTQETRHDGRVLRLADWGVVLTLSSADTARIEREPKDVALTGMGGEVKLSWAHPAKLNKESRLLVKVRQGSEQITDARVEIDLDSGEKISLGFIVNKAVMLGSPERAGRTVRGITITLKMKDVPFVLKLGELLLFHPHFIESSRVIDTQRPDFEFIHLRAADAKASTGTLLTVDDNRVYGVIPAGSQHTDALSWSTPVHQLAGGLVALQFRYSVSEPVGAPCWLTATLIGKNSRVTRQLCPDGMHGEFTEPLGQFPGKLLPDEEVRSILWQAHLPVDQQRATSFDFHAYLGTVRAPSIAETLQNQVLFRIGPLPYRPATLTNSKLRKLVQRGSAWLDIDPFGWTGGSPLLQVADSHYFNVTHVNLTTSIGPAEDKTVRLLDKDADEENRSLTAKLAALGILLMSWIWLRQSFLRHLWGRSFLWVWAECLPCLNVFGRLVRRILRTLYRFRFLVNRSVGVFMLIAGLWLLGHAHDIPLVRSIVGFALVVSAGALWHELRWKHGAKSGSIVWLFGSPTRIPVFVLALTVVVIGWTAWNLERGAVYAAMLPLVATGYFYLPWLDLVVRWAKTGIGMTWGWASLAVVLYYLGLQFGDGRGVSYFFTLGSFAGVLAWHAWLISHRSRIEALWPSVARKIYARAGTLYFTGALIGLILTALFTAAKLEFLAEQVAIIVYYFLIAGTVSEILALCRESRRKNTGKASPAVEGTAG